jgi:hypothetical protein
MQPARLGQMPVLLLQLLLSLGAPALMLTQQALLLPLHLLQLKGPFWQLQQQQQ